MRKRASGHPHLLEELEDLLVETSLDGYAQSESYYADEDSGKQISLRLAATNAGRDDWSKFEELCEEAVKKLFGSEVTNWQEQNETSDSLHRMDLIGRIRIEGGSFWSVVERDFRARYVVFEAKNYADPITQKEINTTEKYLFTTALRPIAIIIARNGVDKNANIAIAGALREQGKLILVITLKELQSMLTGIDQGDSPDNILFEKMDTLLMRIGR